MKPMEHSAFPSDETLAAFIDGQLDEETRKRMVAHVADCEDCYGTVMAGRACESEQESETTKPATVTNPRNRTNLIGLAIAASIAGVLLYPPLSARYTRRRDVAALRSAAETLTRRTTHARISFDLAYQPKPRTFRSGNKGEENWEVKLAALRLQKDTQADTTIAAQHALGLALLLDDRPDIAARTLDLLIMREGSTGRLSEAISKSNDVALLSDLSAANGASADLGRDPTSKQVALEAAERAWRLDPKSPRTLWNRAVALERVNRLRAIAAWNDYLVIDSKSEWSNEARDRRGVLSDEP
jgi:hypothetical protein